MNTASKKDKIIYWIFTSIFVLLDGVMPAFFFNSPDAKRGIAELGYPDYFLIELTIGKVLGGILLIFPFIPARFKEWAYVGFGISLISAFVGHGVRQGLSNGETYAPVIGMVILLLSYGYYHKIYKPFRSEA